VTARRRAEALLLSATVIWGSTFVVTKGILDETTPLIYTSIRFLLASLLIGLLFRKKVQRLHRAALLPGIVLGFLLFTGFAFQTIGLEVTTASKSAFFTGMLVVFTPIFHYIAQEWLSLPRKALLGGNLVGVLLSAAGLFLLTSPAGAGFNIGDGQTLIAAALFAAYIVYLDTVEPSVDRMQMTFVIFLTCGVSAGAAAGLSEEIAIRMGPAFIWPMAYLTVFATVISLGMQNRFQGDTTPTRAAVIFSLEPVIAAVFAYFVRAEELGPAGIAGAVTIFCGLILSELSESIPVLRRPITGERFGAPGPPRG
jgi:drug/metabolite transporter (DMT)-like permease